MLCVQPRGGHRAQFVGFLGIQAERSLIYLAVVVLGHVDPMATAHLVGCFRCSLLEGWKNDEGGVCEEQLRLQRCGWLPAWQWLSGWLAAACCLLLPACLA